MYTRNSTTLRTNSGSMVGTLYAVEYSAAKMRRIPYLYRSFPAIEPYNSWLFCGKRPATEGTSCIFATMYVCTYIGLLLVRRMRDFLCAHARIIWYTWVYRIIPWGYLKYIWKLLFNMSVSYRVAKTLKMQVSFRKRATNYRALLRKMTYKDEAS